MFFPDIDSPHQSFSDVLQSFWTWALIYLNSPGDKSCWELMWVDVFFAKMCEGHGLIKKATFRIKTSGRFILKKIYIWPNGIIFHQPRLSHFPSNLLPLGAHVVWRCYNFIRYINIYYIIYIKQTCRQDYLWSWKSYHIKTTAPYPGKKLGFHQDFLRNNYWWFRNPKQPPGM